MKLLCRIPVDTPSDGSLSGARGHRVLLTSEFAEMYAHTIIDKPVRDSKHWDGKIIGRCLSVTVKPDAIEVVAYLYETESTYGFCSFELEEAKVKGRRSDIWAVTHGTFTGLALTPKPAFAGATITKLEER